MKADRYPECEKLSKVRGVSQTIGEFLDWLSHESPYLIAEYDDKEKLWPATIGIEKLLAEYFEIDLDKVEKEKRDMLDELRKANENI